MAADEGEVERRMLDALSEHGGRTDAAARRYPGARLPWLDLSTGINPNAWAGDAGEVDLRALPTADALHALEAAAASMFGVEPARVAALPGSEIGLRLLATLGLPAPQRHVTPSYGSHAAAFPHAIAIDGLAAAEGGTILLANPNNPDGRVLPADRVLDFARALGTEGGLLVIDEAFADAMPAASILPHIVPDDPVLVFRSFGKFFGLAGVRLGFAVGPEAIVARLRRMLGSWPVSTTAIAIGTAAYRDTDWIAATRISLAESAARLDAVLARHGFEPLGDCPLFRLIETEKAAALFDQLARGGILTRPFDYAPRWLRIGLPGDAAALDRLDRALG